MERLWSDLSRDIAWEHMRLAVLRAEFLQADLDGLIELANGLVVLVLRQTVVLNRSFDLQEDLDGVL